MTPVFIDFETQSAVDLRNVGGRRYATHSSTHVLCLGVSWDDSNNGVATYRVWVPDSIDMELPRFLPDGTEVLRGNELPKIVADAVVRCGVVAAHNASSFDKHVWNRFVGVNVRWIDTIHMARASGLPGGLEKLGQVFTGRGKDSAQSLMKKVRRLEWNTKLDRWYNKYTKPGSVASIAQYCVRDVELLRIVYDKLKTHPFYDNVALELDEIINNRGVGFDEKLASSIAKVSTQIVSTSGAEIEEITKGEIKPGDLRSTMKMHRWLKANGVDLPNLRRETIESFMDDPLKFVTEEADDEYAPDDDSVGVSPLVLRVLGLRKSALRITGAKLERASAVCQSGRLHDLFVYHGAHTGRWSSRIVQVHNLPKGRKGSKDLNYEMLCNECTRDTVLGEATRLGMAPDDVLSALIRPCLVPKPGHTFIISDFGAIECRVLGWLCDEQGVLDVFANGLDPYKDLASTIFGVDYTSVTSIQRDAGKIGVLGSGYGMGAKKMSDFAVSLGVDLSKSGITANDVIEKYRGKFPKIAGVVDGYYEGKPLRIGGIWREYEQAFRRAIDGYSTVVCKCKFYNIGNNVLVRLPSGRHLCYRQARIESRVPRWGGDPRPTIVYQSNRGDTVTYGGKITENIDQAVSRDLMVEALYRFSDTAVLHVHDEVVCEVPSEGVEESLHDLVRIMSSPPAWAPGLPLAAEGHAAPRYSKSKWPNYPTCAS